MKEINKLLVALAFAIVLSCLAFIRDHNIIISDFGTDNIEALSDCEVFDSKHNPVVECKGSQGVCYQITDRLYCSGEKKTK
jgi:hypothetical protein